MLANGRNLALVLANLPFRIGWRSSSGVCDRRFLIGRGDGRVRHIVRHHRRDPVPGIKRSKRRRSSGTQKPQMSAAQASPRPKIESILGVLISLTRSGRNAALTDYRMSMTMFGSSISEAGSSIVKTNGRSLASSIGRFMLLPFGQVYSSDQAKALSPEVQV